jgi:hypothetical protein
MDGELPADLRAKIDELDHDLEEIAAEHPKTLETEEPPVTIYHYTNDKALKGIIGKGRLWCSDIFYLNDLSELKYAVSLATEILDQHTLGGSEDDRRFANYFRRYEQNVEGIAHFFVWSFSRKDNHLGQWRAYADNGRGFAIGFDGKMLEQAFGHENGKPVKEHKIFPVCYDEEKLKDILRRIIVKAIPLISISNVQNLSKKAKNEYMKILRLSLILQVSHTALFFKHPAYEDEREYRFIQIHPANQLPDGIIWRDRPYELIRYREFDWKTSAPTALKETVIGPATALAIGERFITDCLRSHNTYPWFHIRPSGIPYRPS